MINCSPTCDAMDHLIGSSAFDNALLEMKAESKLHNMFWAGQGYLQFSVLIACLRFVNAFSRHWRVDRLFAVE